jgi:hypothetical protein
MNNPEEEIRQELYTDLKNILPDLQETLFTSKMREREILAESVANGGPDNVHSALLNVIDACKLGVRRLALHVGVSRLKMKSMLDGRSDIPADTLNKIISLCEVTRPDLFKD